MWVDVIIPVCLACIDKKIDIYIYFLVARPILPRSFVADIYKIIVFQLIDVESTLTIIVAHENDKAFSAN